MLRAEGNPVGPPCDEARIEKLLSPSYGFSASTYIEISGECMKRSACESR